MPTPTEIIFFLSAAGILAPFVAGPAFIFILYLIRGKKEVLLSDHLPKLSIIIVARNAQDFAEQKLKNTLGLNYPADKLEIIFYSDGSTDNTKLIVPRFKDNNMHFYSSSSHCGKINGMNEAVEACSGEILIFTDIDVHLSPDSLLKLVPYFGDSTVGGVSGGQVVVKKGAKLEDAQNVYLRWGGALKAMENMLGCITTNNGSLYAMRRNLYQNIPPGVTDDLYACMSIILQHHRFLYNPDAKAFMNAPSKDIAHELSRRRRIVSTSIRGIFIAREILNPFKHGFVSISLFFNKVLRRFIPIFLITLLLSNILLLSSYSQAQTLLTLQCSFYFIALLYSVIIKTLPTIPFFTKLSSLAYYFCLGNYGTMLGLIDWVRGKKISKW